jgi:cyclopropane fatty-acyl-phospholipid synthase-like methyltransferase
MCPVAKGDECYQMQRLESSLDIRHTYTSEYYTQDCGGFEAYNKNKGKELEDIRLQAVASIAGVKQQGRVLDLGCGRGELTYYFVKQGFEVTAVDYSESAIKLARECFEGEDKLKEKVQFYCESVCTVPLEESYELAIASDLIEHLSADEVDRLYQRVSQHLKRDGLFVIHTFPNLWYYQYEYPRIRKAAASGGVELPAQPRTKYEMLMHINEQSPRVLKRQLSKHFGEVLLWFGDPGNPGGSLLQKFSSSEMRAAQSLFAIASHQYINIDKVKAYLQMNPLPPIPEGKLQLRVMDNQNQVTVRSEFNVEVEIHNQSNFILNSYRPHPVNIAYHWMDEFGTKSLIFDGERSSILPSIEAMDKKIYKVRIKAPKTSGKYILRVTLVQEGVRWFDEFPTNLAINIPVLVN